MEAFKYFIWQINWRLQNFKHFQQCMRQEQWNQFIVLLRLNLHVLVRRSEFSFDLKFFSLIYHIPSPFCNWRGNSCCDRVPQSPYPAALEGSRHFSAHISQKNLNGGSSLKSLIYWCWCCKQLESGNINIIRKQP